MSLKIKSFTDSIAWQKAHRLVLNIYQLTNKFPPSKKFSLIDQMHRAAISISSNIAEGFSRISKNEKKNFYHIALGSLTELQNQLLVSKDLGYIEKNSFTQSAIQTVEVSKLINGLIKSLNT